MSNNPICARFAPSPTGFLHIGGARTCLFNWLFARANKGKFILRIEDTDRERSKKEFLDEILESIKWLGMDWDEIYYQSKRFDLYLELAKKLLKEQKAYEAEGGAIILNMPQKQIAIEDIVHGNISFDTSDIKDQVLIKSDQTPTYNFACVVDDAQLGISHVIRGDDHISNTPKQIVIYEALGFNMPRFVHIPMILSSDGGRLSKRTGATSIREYQQMGFLSGAIINYLSLLGWSPKDDREIISKEETVKIFSLKNVNNTAAVFDLDKLKWINGTYIRNMDAEKLLDNLRPFLKEKECMDEDNFDRKRLLDLIQLFKERMTTLIDFVENANFLFVQDLDLSLEAKNKLFEKDISKELKLLEERFSNQSKFDTEKIEETFRNLVSELNIKSKILIHPLRAAVTGSLKGPGIFEVVALLGKEKVCDRLNKAIELINNHYQGGN